MYLEDIRRRFWEKVDIPHSGFGCWEWSAADRGNGYGAFKLNGKVCGAHRVVWRMVNGIIPKTKVICHHCDNRGCVNPQHLFLGTYSDNMQDAYDKGRVFTPRHSGEDSPCAFLTDKEVQEIRQKYKTTDLIQEELANIYNVSQQHISKILNYTRR